MQKNQIDQPKYLRFRQWLLNNGCKLDSNLQLPSLLNNSLTVLTTHSIPSNRIILSIPNSLILTAQKVYKFPQLKKLFAHNDDLFDYQACDENEFNILAVFLMYEKTKILKYQRIFKQKQTSTQIQKDLLQSSTSFYEPYFTAASDCSTILDWSDSSYSDLPHSFKQQIVFFQIQMASLKLNMVNYLSSRKQFQQISQNQLIQLFDWAYKFVMTRCFGECFRTTCLIPGVDMFNHGNRNVDHELVNVEMERGEVEDRKYKKRWNGVLDMGLIGGERQIKIECQHYEYLNKQTGKSFEQLLYLNKQDTYEEMNRVNKNKFEKENVEVYNMQFYSQDDRQDNDTDNDEQQQREVEMEFLKEQEKQQVQQFIREYTQFKVLSYKEAKEINEKNVKSKEQNKIEEEKKIEEKIVKQEMQEKKESLNQERVTTSFPTEIAIQQIKQIKEQKKQKQLLTEQYKQSLEKIQKSPQQPQVQKKQQQQSSNSSSNNSSSDQSNQSSQSSSSQTPAWHTHPSTTFSLFSLHSIPPSTQLLLSYGSRTNKFLMIWYGFCYPNNHYDSVSFRLNASFQSQHNPQSLIFDHYYLSLWKQRKELNPYPNVSKEFRLKRGRVNEELIVFLRVFLMNQWKGEEQGKLMGTVPASLEFEEFLFGYMKRVLVGLRERYEEEKIEEWRGKENEDVNCRWKRIYYEEQRNIAEEHIRICQTIVEILKRIREQKQTPLKQIYKNVQFSMLRKIRKYLKLLDQNMIYIRFNPYQQIQ